MHFATSTGHREARKTTTFGQWPVEDSGEKAQCGWNRFHGIDRTWISGYGMIAYLSTKEFYKNE
jgi:hypothetical protein